jgi:hypothetical protein
MPALSFFDEAFSSMTRSSRTRPHVAWRTFVVLVEKELEPKNFGEREDAAQTRQAEELTRLTRRAAIRGPLPSDQPAEHR